MRHLMTLFILLPAVPLMGGTMVRTVEYHPSDFSFHILEGYSVVEGAGFQLKGAPGTPLLPASPQVFILPDGARDATFTAVALDRVELAASGMNILPATELRPLSSTGSAVRFPDPSVYSSDSPWPSDHVIASHSGSLSGTSVASCLVQPWEYLPSRGGLSLVTRMEITVSWEDGQALPLTPGQRSVADARVRAVQRNRDTHSLLMDPLLQGGDSQYLIVCDSAYADIMEPLALHHQGRGLTVETAHIQEIVNSFPGSDEAEKLRNFIRDRYLHHGTVYVLLAGDESLIPVRMVYLFCEGYADTAPVDLYFADLDGTWDGSGDGEYGQPDDDLDLYADVLLGRGLFSTPEEAGVFVDRSLAYQASPPPGDWRTTAVLCGAVLFEDIGYTSEKGCDSIAVEFPPYWDVQKYYEELPGGGFTEHIPVISGGTAWNHYAGHGNDRGIYWNKSPLAMMTSWIASDSLENGQRAGIHTSIACHPARYIEHNSCAEALLQNPGGGGVAVMFNVSYGWEGHWPSIGASEWMCIDLAKQVFRHQAPSLGQAFSTARDLRIPFMEGGYDRTFQSLLSFSAFMDPALRVMRTESVVPVPPVDFSISPPFPNPARRDAPVAFMVDFDEGSAEVSVHDISGRLLWHSVVQSPGRVSWSAADPSGRRVPAGVYIVSARRGDLVRSRLATVLD